MSIEAKPLRWETTTSEGYQRAFTPLGRYIVKQKISGRVFADFPDGDCEFYPSIDAAKDACQAHLEAAIYSLIQLPDNEED